MNNPYMMEQAADSNPYGIPVADEIVPEARKADVNKCTVMSVDFARVGGDEIPAIRIVLAADAGFTMIQTLFLTEQLFNHWTLTPKALNMSDETCIAFGRSIHNSKNEATLDRYLAALADGGAERDYDKMRGASSIEAFITALNALLSNVPVIIVRRPNRHGYLNVSSVRPMSAASNPKFLQYIERGGFVNNLNP